MNSYGSPLECNLVAALRQACRGHRLDVAEHLLCAIETLEHGRQPRTALAEAYLTIAETSETGTETMARPREAIARAR